MFEDDDSSDDDILERYLQEEGLALVPLDFMRELMTLMEDFIVRETGVEREDLGPIIERLEELLGEDGMMGLSLEAIVDWVRTLKDA